MNELKQRIASYLGNGGLFNPEMMEHDKVRDLIQDCLNHIEEQERELAHLNSHFSQILSELQAEKTAREIAESHRGQLQTKLTALEKERDELKLALSNANQLIGSQADENDRTVANILKERDQLKQNLTIQQGIATDQAETIDGLNAQLEQVRESATRNHAAQDQHIAALQKDCDQLRAACAAKIDREKLREVELEEALKEANDQNRIMRCALTKIVGLRFLDMSAGHTPRSIAERALSQVI